MEFSLDRRVSPDDLRMLSTDDEGRNILAGLTFEESREFCAFIRDGAINSRPPEERDRYLDLFVRHEKARLQVIMAEIESEQESLRN